MKDSQQYNERYKITDKAKKIVHKLDMDNKPDFEGHEYRIIDELEDGYIVYIKSEDLSQPSPSYFIDKKYFNPRAAL